MSASDTGQYAPMPPVFGPRSPSSSRLWSCAGRQRDDPLAVGEREDRELFALHELLDEHVVAGVAERMSLAASRDAASRASSKSRRR